MRDHSDIINQLLETESEEDFDNEIVKDLESFTEFSEVREWIEATMPKLGFEPDGHHRWWVKVAGDRRVRLGVSTEEGHIFMVNYLPNTAGTSWYSDQMLTVPVGEPVIAKLREWGMIPVRESEENFDDEDAEVVKDVTVAPLDSHPEIDDWMKSTLPKYGFTYQPVGVRSWEKKRGDTLVSVGSSTRPGCVLLVRYKRTMGNRMQNEEMLSVEAGLPALLQLKKWGIISLAESEDEEFGDEETFEMKDVLGPEDKHEIYTFIKTGRMEINGSVRRIDHHYVHENTTRVDLNVDYPVSWNPTEQEVEDRDFIQSKMDPEVNRLEEDINDNLRRWNHKIYRELEASYEDYVSDDQVAENLRANEYTFDEDGNLGDGEIPYDELEQRAQARARDKWREHLDQNDWDHLSESVIAEWKWLLKNKGFNDVKISWSGFGSQGDGASFTAGSIDFEKYFTGPDPIEFPPQERDQLWESEAEDEDFDTDLGKELTGPDAETVEQKLLSRGFAKEEGVWIRKHKTGERHVPERAVVVMSMGDGYYKLKVYRRGKEGWSFSHEWDGGLNMLDEYLDRIPVSEAEEGEDEDLDLSDVYSPDRKRIAHLRTKSDYAEYQQRVADFFDREGINSISQVTDADGNALSDSFSSRPCECCRRPLGGTRMLVSGYNPTTKEVQNYKICLDCEYYIEYGQLDDQTMMDLKDDPVTEAEEEGLDDDVDFREVEIDYPTHGMPVGRDKIHSQPATQYYEKFPNNAWEIYVERPAKPTKDDPRDYRTVFIGILIRTNEGWHQINRANESWVGPAYQTPSEVVQKMFDSNKEYVWRHLGSMVTKRRRR